MFANCTVAFATSTRSLMGVLTQAIKSLMSQPAVPYRTARMIIVGQGRVGKTAFVNGVQNGLCHGLP